VKQEEVIKEVREKISGLLDTILSVANKKLNQTPILGQTLEEYSYDSLLQFMSVCALFLSSDELKGLTARLLDSIRSLEQSSKSLENLTKWLIGLTIILTILTVVSILYR